MTPAKLVPLGAGGDSPRDGRELDEALRVLEEAPMNTDELAWMRKVGVNVRSGAKPRVFAPRTA